MQLLLSQNKYYPLENFTLQKELYLSFIDHFYKKNFISVDVFYGFYFSYIYIQGETKTGLSIVWTTSFKFLFRFDF